MPRTLFPKEASPTPQVPDKGPGPDTSCTLEDVELARRTITETGCTYNALARILGKSPSTLVTWRKRIPEFEEACKEGWDAFNSHNVEVSLLQRATGYEYEEVHEEYIFLKGKKRAPNGVPKNGKNGNGEKTCSVKVKGVEIAIPAVKRKIIHKQVLPDVAAIVFWLCNRGKGRWENAQRQIMEGNVKHEHLHSLLLDMSGMGKERLEQLKNIFGQAKAEGVRGFSLKDDRLRLGADKLERLR